jgi:hypothetical protein
MPRSLQDLLRMIPDPRGRRGRVYPLYGLLAVLILAVMHGENSLLGMWEWAKEREARMVNQAAFWVLPTFDSTTSSCYLVVAKPTIEQRGRRDTNIP